MFILKGYFFKRSKRSNEFLQNMWNIITLMWGKFLINDVKKQVIQFAVQFKAIFFIWRKDIVKKKLGEGAFSLVVECEDHLTGTEIALKIQRQKHKESAEKEIQFLQTLQKNTLPGYEK